MAKPLNVYWSPTRIDSEESDWSILYEQPDSLFTKVAERRVPGIERSFLGCPAFTAVAEHTYIMKAPLTMGLRFAQPPGNGPSEFEAYGYPWGVRDEPHLQNAYMVRPVLGMNVFAEEEVEMQVTAPFFSDSPHLQGGAMVPGRFNIGTWFRPVTFEMALWEGVTQMHFKEGEHIAYIQFLTDRPINLLRYRDTVVTQKISSTLSRGTEWEPRVPLAKRYQRFKAARMREVVLKEIKANLV